MNTMISISSIEIIEKNVIISGYDLDKAFMTETFEEDFEVIKFSFSTEKRGDMSYLFKVLRSKADGKSIKDLFDKIVKQGTIVILNDNFKIK